MLYVIIALEKHARSDDVRRAMLSSPLDNTHDGTTLGATCLHGPWTAPTVRLPRAWHAIIALGLNTPLDQVGCGMPTCPFGSTHGWMRSGIAFHYRPSVAHTFGRRRALQDIIALRSIEGRTTLVLTFHHRPLDNLHSQTLWSVA